MVKRAVGTKACILGKALKCTFTKGANFLEVREGHCVLLALLVAQARGQWGCA